MKKSQPVPLGTGWDFYFECKYISHNMQSSYLRSMVELRGIDIIKDPLRRAVAGGTHPHRIKMGSIPLILNAVPIKNTASRRYFLLVELRGIEPLSESNLEGTSPGAVCYLHSLILAGTNTLQDLVAS